MNCKLLLGAILLMQVVAVSGAAQSGWPLYDNGPANGNRWAWLINSGAVTSNTFVIDDPSMVTDLNFLVWLYPGDLMQSAEVSITSSEFGGTTYFDGVLAFTPVRMGCSMNYYGFMVCVETAQLTAPLNRGTYWLNVQNGETGNGDPIYWDENSGPSMASQSSIGTIPSESFTVFGECLEGRGERGCQSPPTTPEPGSLVLFGSGITVFLVAVAKPFLR